MKCSNCGNEIANDSIFCEYCGTKVKMSQSKYAPGIKLALLRLTKFIKNNYRKYALALMLILCIGAVYVFCSTNYFQQHQEPYTLEWTDSDAIERPDAVSEDSSSIYQASSLSQTEIDSLLAHGYVDLGLPSGTLWKEKDERGFYDYHNALEKFSDMLPTKIQFQELIDFCQWSFSGWDKDTTYYKVTGKNGESIFFTNNGGIYNDGRVYGHNQNGLFWTSTKNGDAENSYVLSTYRDNVDNDAPFEGNEIEVTNKVYQIILKSVHLAR